MRSEVVTFQQLKARTAADIREVCKLLEERAKVVEEGNLYAMETLLEKEWLQWRELLIIRYAHAVESCESARLKDTRDE